MIKIDQNQSTFEFAQRPIFKFTLKLLALFLTTGCAHRKSQVLSNEQFHEELILPGSKSQPNYYFALADWTRSLKDNERKVTGSINSWISMSNLFSRNGFRTFATSTSSLYQDDKKINSYISENIPLKLNKSSTISLHMIGHGAPGGMKTTCEDEGYYNEEMIFELLFDLIKKDGRRFLLISDTCNAGVVLGNILPFFATHLDPILDENELSESITGTAHKKLAEKLKELKSEKFIISAIYIGESGVTKGSYNYFRVRKNIPLRGIFSSELPSIIQASTSPISANFLLEKFQKTVREKDLPQNLEEDAFFGSIFSFGNQKFMSGNISLKESEKTFKVRNLSLFNPAHYKGSTPFETVITFDEPFLNLDSRCQKLIENIGFNIQKNRLIWNGTTHVDFFHSDFATCIAEKAYRVELRSGAQNN